MFKDNDHVLDHVDDYLFEALAPEDSAYVERHSEGCRLCKVALEEARKRVVAFESVPACEASEQLIQSTLQHIETYRSSSRWFKRYVVPSACAAVVAFAAILSIFHVYYHNLKASPYELQVVGQNELLAGTRGALRVYVSNRDSRAAVGGVPVSIELRNTDRNEHIQLASFQTNEQGTGQPRFDLPDWPEGRYQLFVTARPRGETESIAQTITLKRSWKLMLSSDKPVYQPGQEIRLRSLALRRPDLKPVTGQGITFTITDPKGNVIFKRQDVTSKFGISAADCPLANEIIEGPYAVQCKVGDTDSKLTVEVKKYVLPKFKINLDLDEPYYRPGQMVRGKIQADYFFGKPVADGTIEIKVETTEVRPQVIQRLNAQADAEGKAKFEYRLPSSLVGRPQDSGDARVAFVVNLTDSAGQKQSKSVARMVTTRPYRIEIIPEAGALVQNLPNKIYVYASHADGRPAKVRLLISGVDKELSTNDLGIAFFEMTPDEETVQLTITAKGDNDFRETRTVKLQCGQLMQDFLVRTDKAVYEGGDTVRLTALAGGVEPIFIDLIKDGQTLMTETIDLKNGKGDYHFDLPADVFGTLELCAYRFGGEAVPVRKMRVLYVRQARQLNIDARLDHKEYRPGHKAKLLLTLKDTVGKATPGAISLAAVDEAVFAVLDQAPGMEKTFYMLEQQLLQPVYAIYPWSPDLTTSIPPVERVQFEQALFSKTWQNVGQNPPPPPGRVRPGAQPMQPKTPHSLSISNFPVKLQQIQAVRQRGLDQVEHAWMAIALGVFGTLLVAGIYGFWRTFGARILEAFVEVTIGDSLAGCFLGALLLVLLAITAITTLGTNANQTFTRVGNAVNTSGGADRQFLMEGGGGAVGGMPMPMRAFAEKSAAPPPSKTELVAQAGSGTQEQVAPPRVREWFPETLLWRPEVITDDKGQAPVEIDLADSITTWRLSASAIAADGRLGATQSSIRVFQPFFVDLNLPVSLTRGDEVAIPTVVYNYLDKPQTVELLLEDGKWFERLDEATKRLELAPGEVRALNYRLKVTKVGNHQLQVTAKGSGVADAIKKQIEVVPDGRRVEQVANGTLMRPAEMMLTVPENAIEGSAKAFVKIYPSTFSQLVEGLDNIFRMPSGCFEQTSSTTYPNILALDYLRRTKKSVPEVEAKAKQYIHLGYQRLLTFEIAGGGFDWFGRPPANLRLTAYGLMEFDDMAKVHDVDPKLLERTRDWIMRQRQKDGSWNVTKGLHQEADPARGQSGDMARYSMTAYVAWAVYSGQKQSDATPTLAYLLSVRPEEIPDPYVLALACNAMLAIDPNGKDAQAYLSHLESLKRSTEDGKRVWWEKRAGSPTSFYGGGQSANVETTALATLAVIQAGQSSGTIQAALNWLTEQKDGHGTWRSTQATVLALKALVAGTGAPLGDGKERRIEIVLGDGTKRDLVVPADQGEVMQLVDLSDFLKVGQQRLTVTDHSDTAAGYQIAFRYHVPGVKDEKKEPLTIDVAYDRSDLKVGDTVTATANVVNRMAQQAPMVILDLPIPAGFAVEIDDLAKLQSENRIAKYQVSARSTIVYLRNLDPGQPLKLTYRLRATMPVKITVPPAQVYEYYDPAKRGSGSVTRMVVD